jgi:nitrogenase subunit NifH
MTLPKDMIEMKEYLSDEDGMIEMMLKLMGNTEYLKQRLENLEEKLVEVSRMLMIVVMHGELPSECTDRIQVSMLSNKEFVNFAEELASKESAEDMLKAMQSNPMFNVPEELTDEEMEDFKKAWGDAKEIFTLAGMQHELLEEE